MLVTLRGLRVKENDLNYVFVLLFTLARNLRVVFRASEKQRNNTLN